jgi:hypothetical protein
MSVSCADGNGSYGTYHVYQGIPNRIPSEEATALQHGCVGARLPQGLWVNDLQPAKKILRLIRINHIISDTKSSLGSVLDFPDKLVERVSEPGPVAVSESMLALRVCHGYELHGVMKNDALVSSSAAARSN